ncbi:MAG TPA: hypothetical protein VNV36_22965 [Pseudomonas sp.]|uniref:hypothetical protein n=1 Tax=Pseudomonas sp. TaxID=306 RepID=UPI002BEE02FF|nr:hypothetical protein [Pseudomonas sp.]HWH89622.1 hypothetical protein [Pseudomonas sp.]
MNSLTNTFSLEQQLKLQAYDRWHRAFDDDALRSECPDTWHEELLRQADEMDRLGLVDWQEWRELRVEADEAYLRAAAGGDYHD